MRKIRLILADDHKIIIEGLKGVLSSEPDIELTGTATNGRELVEMAFKYKPDVDVTPLIDGEIIRDYRNGSNKNLNLSRKLTTRQKEVLSMLAEGYTAKEIEKKLHISVRTVEFHKYKMMEELGIDSSAELIMFAVKHKLTAS